MSASQSWHRPTVIPRIITKDPHGLVDFVRQVFGAEGEFRPGPPTELRLGDSLVMISDGGGVREPASAFLHVYVDDADAVFQLAVTSGATPVEKPADMPWGERTAMVRDGWGNTWQLATAAGLCGLFYRSRRG
jgi:PhnB protein